MMQRVYDNLSSILEVTVQPMEEMLMQKEKDNNSHT